METRPTVQTVFVSLDRISGTVLMGDSFLAVSARSKITYFDLRPELGNRCPETTHLGYQIISVCLDKNSTTQFLLVDDQSRGVRALLKIHIKTGHMQTVCWASFSSCIMRSAYCHQEHLYFTAGNAIYQLSIAGKQQPQEVNFRTRMAGLMTQSGYEDGSASQARFSRPQGMTAVPYDNQLLVCDCDNNRIRAVSLVTNQVTTFLGSGRLEDKDGPAATASLVWPSEIVSDALGNLFIANNLDVLRRYNRRSGMLETIHCRCSGALCRFQASLYGRDAKSDRSLVRIDGIAYNDREGHCSALKDLSVVFPARISKGVLSVIASYTMYE